MNIFPDEVDVVSKLKPGDKAILTAGHSSLNTPHMDKNVQYEMETGDYVGVHTAFAAFCRLS